MFAAIAKAIGQLSDPGFRRILWTGIGLSAAAFAILWVAVIVVLTETSFFAWFWLDWAVDLLGGLAALVLSWLLFPAVVSVIIGFFLEDAAGAVEARHYPHLAPVRRQRLAETVVTTLKFLGVALVLNLFVLVFLIVPPIFPFVFYLVNGYLLSREYYELVALRRLDDFNALGLRKAHQGELLGMGVLFALALTVPVVNLVAPIIATAAMVHLIQGWRQRLP